MFKRRATYQLCQMTMALLCALWHGVCSQRVALRNIDISADSSVHTAAKSAGISMCPWDETCTVNLQTKLNYTIDCLKTNCSSASKKIERLSVLDERLHKACSSACEGHSSRNCEVACMGSEEHVNFAVHCVPTCTAKEKEETDSGDVTAFTFALVIIPLVFSAAIAFCYVFRTSKSERNRDNGTPQLKSLLVNFSEDTD